MENEKYKQSITQPVNEQLEIQENYNDMLVKELNDLKAENDKLKQGLHGIYNLCDNENPTHEHIWHVANECLNPA